MSHSYTGFGGLSELLRYLQSFVFRMTVCAFGYHFPNSFVSWKESRKVHKKQVHICQDEGSQISSSHFFFVDNLLSTGTSNTEVRQAGGLPSILLGRFSGLPDLQGENNREIYGCTNSPECSHWRLILTSCSPNTHDSPRQKPSNIQTTGTRGAGC